LGILVVLSAAAFALERTAELAAQTQAQNAADAAALAGAVHLLRAPDDESGAKAEAMKFAVLNPVRGSKVELRPEDIQVDLEEGVVRVKLRAKVLPLPPPVAWLKVSAEAAAEAMAASAPGEPPRRLKKLSLID
jgi:Flp pilus assembly protein TadG